MATVERHREISAQFLEHAEDELRRGDLLQASEKAWGAVAHYVNSEARERGWPLGSHRDVNSNATKLILSDDSAKEDLLKELSVVNILHANFYQEFYERWMVETGIVSARTLLDALADLNARVPEVQNDEQETGT